MLINEWTIKNHRSWVYKLQWLPITIVIRRFISATFSIILMAIDSKILRASSKLLGFVKCFTMSRSSTFNSVSCNNNNRWKYYTCKYCSAPSLLPTRFRTTADALAIVTSINNFWLQGELGTVFSKQGSNKILWSLKTTGHLTMDLITVKT